MADAPSNPVANPSSAPTALWKARVTRPSREFPRRFLPVEVDLSNWESVRLYLADLVERPLPDEQALLAWIRDLAEFQSAIGEEGSRLYIDMTCFTQDPEKEKAYLRFVEEMEPKLAPEYDKINRKIAGHPASAKLPSERYGKWLDSIRVSLELFREENIPLHTEVAKLSQQYQKTCGEMTAEWNGEIKTLSQLSPFLQDPDRSIREKAWRTIAERRFQDKEKLEEIFDSLFKLRNRIATNLGLKDYIEYSFKAYMRTDYGTRDCFAFHEAIEKTVVPRMRAMMEERRKRMGLDTLRPWDLSCDVYGRPPLRPFKDSKRLIEGVGEVFRRLDPELAGYFDSMVEQGLLDLDNRVGKAPGGYQSTLEEVRLPFIFMNAVGLNDDVFTLLHESGHAFHSFLSRGYELGFNRHSPMEFAEVASMAMERLGAPHLDVFYSPQELPRATQSLHEDVFRLLPWVATIDAFQHGLYSRPEHTREERTALWLELDHRFGTPVDWSGLEQFKTHSWHRQLHIFELPFYYIEYGIALTGALQVWLNAKNDQPKALADYKRALALGGTRGLRELFSAAGLRFDLGEQTLRPLADAAWDAWSQGAQAEAGLHQGEIQGPNP